MRSCYLITESIITTLVWSQVSQDYLLSLSLSLSHCSSNLRYLVFRQGWDCFVSQLLVRLLLSPPQSCTIQFLRSGFLGLPDCRCRSISLFPWCYARTMSPHIPWLREPPRETRCCSCPVWGRTRPLTVVRINSSRLIHEPYDTMFRTKALLRLLPIGWAIVHPKL